MGLHHQTVHFEQRLCGGSFRRKVLIPRRTWNPCEQIKPTNSQYASPISILCLLYLIVLRQDVLQKRPTTPTLKIHTINYLKNETKSFDYTLSVLANLEAQTRAEIARLGGNKGLEGIMDLLHVPTAHAS